MRYAIILASGTGSRLGLGYNKVFAKINDLPILYYTIKNFEDCNLVDKIIITAGNHENGTCKKDKKIVEEIIKKNNFKKIKTIVAGGATRMRSVQNGLEVANLNDDDIVLIQDGARPFTKPDLISQIIEAAQKYGSAVCGVAPIDTIALLDDNNFSVKTFNRDKLIAIQTPMAAKWNLLKQARDKAIKEGCLEKIGFEDSALIQELGEKVKIIKSDYSNMKITTKEDLDSNCFRPFGLISLDTHPENSRETSV